MKFKYSKYLVGAVLAISATSCTDILDQPNLNGFSASNFWQTESNFTGNVTALMNQWRGFDQMTLMNAGELRTDIYWYLGGVDGTSPSDSYVILNNLTADDAQFSNYGGYYGLISNCNTYLYYDNLRGEVVEPKLREYMKGMIYGMRAYCNFQIHKMYGTGPIRDDAKVIEGVYNDKDLVKKQATVEEFLNNIKLDIKRSIESFEKAGNATTYGVFNSSGGNLYWNPMVTQMLAGEVYLWSGKVSTVGVNDKGHIANPADVAVAKTHFLNVLNSGKYSLYDDYFTAINTNNGNKERIFGTYYGQGEASTNWYNYIMYDKGVGKSIGVFWTCYEDDGVTPSPNASRLTYKYVPGEENVKTQGGLNTYQLQRMPGQNRYQSCNALYYTYNDDDTRKAMFMPLYRMTAEESTNKIMNIKDFDKSAHTMAATYVRKYKGMLDNASNTYQGWTYMTYYRLPLVYTYLAEIANYEGNNADVAKYMNYIIKRAYGDKWDEAKYGFKTGSFAENEVGILQEKTREFFQEGQRWWDLRRMTLVKGGQESDHLIFNKEGSLSWGLDAASHPEWVEITPNGVEVGTYKIRDAAPLLDYATQKHRVLWPINKALIDSEKELLQTPGYQGTGEKDRKPW